MDWGLVSFALWAATGFVGFVGRNAIKSWMTGGIEYHFNAELEKVKTEHRRSEESFKSDLRSKEAEIAALRDGTLNARAQRQALIDKRRLDAIDRVWSEVVALAPFKGVAAQMAVLNFDVMAKEAKRNPGLRQFAEVIASAGGVDFANAEHPGKNERLFVSDLAWAYLSAYQVIVNIAVARAKVLTIGVDNPKGMFAEDYIRNVVKAALPHRTEFIDKSDISNLYYLLDELELVLLIELRKMLSGEAEEEAGIRRAAEVTRQMRSFYEAAVWQKMEAVPAITQ